jgi:hypothetical protein
MEILPLRHGDSSREDFHGVFDRKLSVLENLERIVPGAVEIGILPAESDPKQMVVRLRGRLLDLHGNLGEQIGSANGTPLELIDARSKVRLHMRYRPDGKPVQTQVVEVSPVDPLVKQMDRFFAQLREETWLRRRKKDLRFRLRTKASAVNLDRSAAWQDLKSGDELQVEPRLVWGWPMPRRTIALMGRALAGLAVFWIILVAYGLAKQERTVHIATTQDCVIRYLSGDKWVDSDPIAAKEGGFIVLPASADSVIVQPARSPAYLLENFRVNAWAVFHKKVRLDPVARLAGGREEVAIRIKGINLSRDNEALEGCYVNGFPVDLAPETAAGLKNYSVRLPKTAGSDLGYRIEFRGHPGLVLDQRALYDPAWNTGIIRRGDFFLIDKSGDYELTFPYIER